MSVGAGRGAGGGAGAARPLVSVIVAVRNGEKYLAEALGSAFAQTYSPLEVIVVDDGSTDGTGLVATTDARVVYIRQPNQGVAVARNTGVARAGGEFLAFLDADDLWLPAKLERQVGYLLEHPEAGLVFTHQRLFLSPDTPEVPGWVARDLMERDHAGFVPSALVVRREVLGAVGPFDPAYEVGEDYDWFVRARDSGLALAVVPETLLLKRVHGSNLTSRVEDCRVNLLRIARASLARRVAAGQTAPAPSQPAPAQRQPAPAQHQPASVSVIIPVFNGERYLRVAIESAAGQTHRPLEILVVDDGSTDGSGAIAVGFGPPVRCVRQEHGGIGAARNRGVEATQGCYLAFLDADDLWESAKLAVQVAALESRSRTDAVFTHVRQFVSPDVSGSVRATLDCPPEPVAGLYPGTLLIRREAFLKVGFFPTDRKVGEFLDWYARAKAANLALTVLPEVLAHRRIHGGNHTLRHKADLRDYAAILKAAIDRRHGAPG